MDKSNGITVFIVDDEVHAQEALKAVLQEDAPAVSYTHLTLPTNREVLISMAAVHSNNKHTLNNDIGAKVSTNITSS